LRFVQRRCLVIELLFDAQQLVVFAKPVGPESDPVLMSRNWLATARSAIVLFLGFAGTMEITTRYAARMRRIHGLKCFRSGFRF